MGNVFHLSLSLLFSTNLGGFPTTPAGPHHHQFVWLPGEEEQEASVSVKILIRDNLNDHGLYHHISNIDKLSTVHTHLHARTHTHAMNKSWDTEKPGIRLDGLQQTWHGTHSLHWWFRKTGLEWSDPVQVGHGDIATGQSMWITAAHRVTCSEHGHFRGIRWWSGVVLPTIKHISVCQ